MRVQGVARLLAAAAAVVSLAGCMPRPGSAGPRPGSGQALFEAKGCPQCHQVKGVGGHKGPDLTHVGRRLSRPRIEAQIVNGGDAMPAYKDVLTAEETKSLVRYLRRLR